jgi:hypothetical protein
MNPPTETGSILINAEGLNKALANFASERNWDQYHSPCINMKNRVASIFRTGISIGYVMRRTIQLGLIFFNYAALAPAFATSIGDVIWTPDWVQVRSTEKASYYVDRTSIHRPSRHLRHLVKFKYLINLNSVTPQGAQSVTVNVNYDCKNNSMYTDGTSIFRSEMGRNLIDSAGGNVPITLNQRTISMVCN